MAIDSFWRIAMGVATIVVLSKAERADLERLVRASSTAQNLALRARMILALASGLSITETAAQLRVWRKTVSQWRRRWLTLSGSARERLSDEPRSGGPCRITAEEKRAVIALACKRPKEFGLPLSHWSASELAREAHRQKLVKSLSPRTAGRLLKRCRP